MTLYRLSREHTYTYMCITAIHEKEIMDLEKSLEDVCREKRKEENNVIIISRNKSTKFLKQSKGLYYLNICSSF